VKVLASRRFPGRAFEELRDVEILDAKLPGALDGAVRPEVGGLAVVHETIDERTLELLPGLRVIANYGAGYDTIDVAACARRGVAVTNTPGVLDAATADFTIGLIIASRMRVVEADAYIRDGRWRTRGDDALIGQHVTGAVLGIVGLGHIGTAVARRARGFDMTLLYTKRHRLGPDEERQLGLAYRPLDDLLAEADVVSLHVPLTPETDGLLDARRLALIRDGASLVNTARGRVVDEAALVAELVSGRIRAGLDVFAHEPDVPAELRALANVVLAPHVASVTHATREALTRLLVDNLLAAERGEPLLTPVPVP
jgi:lactate dehydrogenase-like 2-hydroxyacid dehydrogenase